MASPTVLSTFTTAEHHIRITGLLELWKSPDSAHVRFGIPALRYSRENQVVPTNGRDPSKSLNTAFYVLRESNPENGSEDDCLIRLKSGTIEDWLRGEWIAEIEAGTMTKSGYDSFSVWVWKSDRKSVGIYYGSIPMVSKLLTDAAIPDELHIRMRLRHTAPSLTKGPHSLTQELEHLKTSVDRLESMINFLNRPSVDMTRISFGSHDGPLKYLFVPSQLLLKYGYFQACHASGFSETEAQPMDLSEVTTKETSPANKDSDLRVDPGSKEVSNMEEDSNLKEVSGSDKVLDSDEDSDLDVDSDSDAEWELEEEEYEHSADLKFRATIHVEDISRRTYKAFIEWALCGSLHFAPCRSAYAGYVESCKTSNVEVVLAWPVWANDHCTSINKFGNLKTLTSPRSLYRLADKLPIPGLKAPCRQQITENLQVATVIQQITKIRDHPELLKDAYEYVRNNWDSVVQQKNFVRIISNCPRSVSKVFHETVLTKLSSNK